MANASGATKPAYVNLDENQTLQFVSLFVHDLEAPLVALKSLLRLLGKGRYDQSNPTHKSLVSSSNIALDRAETLIYDLLSAARAGQTEMVPNISEVNLGQLIDRSIKLVEPAATENRIKIINNSEKRKMIVSADDMLLARILDNLLYNAVRHTPSGEEIQVKTAIHDNNLIISIIDSGPGFGDLDPDELFTIYKQAEFRMRGLHRGVGIGLYFCRLAIGKMGGTITAENYEGKGAAFNISLPLLRGEKRT